jgi:glycosyltransferase involved in cell wall biosynthesis
LQQDPDAWALAPEDSERYAESIRHLKQIVSEPQRLVFFCVMLRRTLWNLLAGFDEVFGTGNFEDDDFCIRTRLAGYRMSVVRNVFVYHHERRTFEANGLNHGEWLAKNQAIFGGRISRWSRSLRPQTTTGSLADALSVIVPVLPGRTIGLLDTLASLTNQTVHGFETVVVYPIGVDVTQQLKNVSSWLRLKVLPIPSDVSGGVAPLLNAGRFAASGSVTAYLPAADIYYPFHLELLLAALNAGDAEAVCSAWSVLVGTQEGERRGPVQFHDAQPGIELGDWAPLLCWMHQRNAAPDLLLDPSFGSFSSWEFLLRLRDSVRYRYLCRVTCERSPDAPTARDAADVERVMAAFPVKNSWQESQRQQFLEGVRQGNWEDRLVLQRNDRARRARTLMMTNGPPPTRANPAQLSLLRSRLEDVASRVVPIWRNPSCPDILLFSIIEWTALTQRPHHFADGLAARGHRVFWVDVHLRPPGLTDSGNLVRELKPGIYQLTLPALQGEIYRLEWRKDIVDTMSACFAFLRNSYGISSAVQLVNFPRWEPLVTMLNQRFGWPIVYDCLDDQQAFAHLYGNPLGQSEQMLLSASAKVLVSGKTLYEAVRVQRPDTLMVPNATDYELFSTTTSAGLLDHLSHPVIGFFGAFADWLDLDWIDASASRYPQWSFVYIGREAFAKPAARQRWKSITNRPNISVFAQAQPSKLAQYLSQFDVCIMPFQDVPVTRSMNAVKLFEYLAAGKSVVATELPETAPLSAAGLIATYKTHEESFYKLEETVRDGPSEEFVNARKAFAAMNTWTHRIDALAAALNLIPASQE